MYDLMQAHIIIKKQDDLIKAQDAMIDNFKELQKAYEVIINDQERVIKQAAEFIKFLGT